MVYGTASEPVDARTVGLPAQHHVVVSVAAAARGEGGADWIIAPPTSWLSEHPSGVVDCGTIAPPEAALALLPACQLRDLLVVGEANPAPGPEAAGLLDDLWQPAQRAVERLELGPGDGASGAGDRAGAWARTVCCGTHLPSASFIHLRSSAMTSVVQACGVPGRAPASGSCWHACTACRWSVVTKVSQ